MTVALDHPSAALPAGWGESLDHEELLIRRGPRAGVPTIVAVHSTVLGPALGGCRMWAYPTLEDGIRDALRLSSAMTLKAAAAGIALGGGKGVICLPPGLHPSAAMRHELLRDFADTVNMLSGDYITAEDVGTTSDDMALLAGFTRHVVGRPRQDGGSGDPGEFTAAGVEAAMRSCMHFVHGSPDLAGRSVAIVGVGSVGERLARRLVRVGAMVTYSDVDPRKRVLVGELGGRWLEPDEALRAEVDILAPCALGGALDGGVVEQLRCRAVCGSANNQLAHDGLHERLAERGILYAPDFIVNAGGLINVSLELMGYDRGLAIRRAAGIEQLLDGILSSARERGITPLAAAQELAVERLAGAAHVRDLGGRDAA